MEFRVTLYDEITDEAIDSLSADAEGIDTWLKGMDLIDLAARFESCSYALIGAPEWKTEQAICGGMSITVQRAD